MSDTETQAQPKSPQAESPSPLLTPSRLLIIALVVGVWITARVLGWVGYAGADDQYYARFAHLLHRVPMNHMEFRMVVVGSLRAAMAIFGTSETAVCMAPLFYSGMLFASVAWFVGWPRNYSWPATGSMLLVSLIPIDVSFATYPGPAALSAGLTALGMVCILKGNKGVGIFGGLILALAFMTHFLNFFFVGLFCLTALAVDWRRYWIPVVACVLFSGGLLATEMITYNAIADNPKARFDSFSAMGEGIPTGARSNSQLEFFLMPLQILILSKPFGFGLLLLLISGGLMYKSLTKTQRIVWITTIGFWFWLGYGTLTPYSYRPATRGMHYYTPLIFGLCALAPLTVEMLFAQRRWLARGIVGLLLLLYIGAISVSGRWGSQVECSGELLKYAQAHPDETFLTDVYTLNEMYVLNHFQMPENVMVLDSNAQEHHLLVNKEPAGHTPVCFPEAKRADALLINLSRTERPAEDEFLAYLADHAGEQIYYVAPSYRLLFAPFGRWLGDRGFALKDSGAEVRTNK